MTNNLPKTVKKHLRLSLATTLITGLLTPPLLADNTVCFESRKGASEVTPQEIKPEQSTSTNSVIMDFKCSPKTGAVLWWADPFVNTIPMGEMSVAGDYQSGEAVVRPRVGFQKSYRLCGTTCHNGRFPPQPKDKNPRALSMHRDLVPDALNLQHGKQSIWCFDCHHPSQRNALVDNFGKPISFNQTQKLCGKCHGATYRDWREGIHGKRIGAWASKGKKRWFVCTECHNPHDVQQGTRQSSFAQITPESAPRLPKGVLNRDHELKNADGSWKSHYLPENKKNIEDK